MSGPDWERFGLVPTTQAVWDAWNALPNDEPRPVHTIAAALGMEPAEVAAIVYPAERFGAWSDDQEPQP